MAGHHLQRALITLERHGQESVPERRIHSKGVVTVKRNWLTVWLLFFLLWTLFVLYPNPARLGLSLVRIVRPPLDPVAVGELAATLPSDAAVIERHILRTFPYQHDWITYGVPWYYPSVKEALRQGTGDCKTRFVVLASIYEALQVPYRQVFSLSHYWVTYDGKRETALEAEHNAWMVRDEEGSRLQVPREDWEQIWDNFVAAFWDPMPHHRKWLWFGGLPVTLLAAKLYQKKKE